MPRMHINLDAKIKVKAEAKVALDSGQVVQAALQLLDKVGLDGLTMRRLAEHLNIKAASLYWHVADKNELIVLLANEICSTFVPPDSTLSWREQMEQFAHQYRRILLSHQDAARVMLLSGAPSGDSRLDLVELLLGVMLKAGFSANDAAYAGFLMNDYITTFVMEETRYDNSPLEGKTSSTVTDSSFPNWIDQLPADRYPHIHALAPHWANVNMDEQFRFGITVLLDGLAKRLIQTSR